MLFNSIQFLVFFPIVTALYYLLPHRFRWAMLLAASCIFYMAYVPKYILILAATILVDYFAAFYIYKSKGRRKKIWLNVSILSTVAILFVFKYFNFFNDNIDALARLLHWNYSKTILKLALPIGLSFHTFQSLSYVIEVYRGNYKPEKNFGIYALYVMFYPQLVAGPIERPQNLLWQFREKHSFDIERISSGLYRMLWGLFKKIVIADRLSIYVDMVYNQPGKQGGISAILATIFFAYQVYCDFSGYSDIALGAAEVMGFKLMRNFNRPYSSKNISEFWQRWHISLSTWFYDYLFNPISIAKRNWGIWAIVYGLIVTFLVSGIWHGAGWTYVTWGLIHGAGLSLLLLTSKFRKKLSKLFPERLYNFISVLFTFTFLCFGYVFFRAHSVYDALIILSSMFHGLRLEHPFSAGIETNTDLVIIAILLPIMLLAEKWYDDNPMLNFSKEKPLYIKWATAWTGIFCILDFGTFTDAHSFIYFKF